MVYFLGRDVSVVVTTESATANEKIGTKLKKAAAGTTVTGLFADAMNTAAFASNTSVPDLTGVDISVGAMDEDITYIGQKGTGKVEQKKEITVTLTRKKNTDTWDTIFNGPSDHNFLASYSADQQWGARWGLDGSGAIMGDGLINPKDAADGTDSNFGYRVHIMMKSGSELIAIPNCTLTAYTTTLGADAVVEESLEFSTQQSILNSSDGIAMNVTLTPKASF
jgi:hypothetical protein|tara:strand:+ start:3363 stop:4031 length:669 start_codon:yes stop_codon:yes gene_type:complete